jgi:hypothetical protein
MKNALAVSAILIIITLLAVLIIGYNLIQNTDNSETYVGVTYCGNSVSEGKMLIDRVKGYTNLFVLQSGQLQRSLESVDELGDYAVSSGLYFLPYFGTYIESTFSTWLAKAKEKWGTQFLGVYYGDEAGGKMLDGNVEFRNETKGDVIKKTIYGDIVLQKANGVVIHYELSGIIHVSEPVYGNDDSLPTYTTFYPNGTIIGDRSPQSSFKTYDDLIKVKPFRNMDEIANAFLARDQNKIEYLSNQSVMVFTSDYALYWWDYLSGYDVMLSQIGWNLTIAQQIALVRGAAKQQNKDWGIIITWKYNNPPYLDTGSEILSQMRTSYEAGAKYFVLFNYYEEDSTTYGTMKDQHFQALENFWNNVVKNPQIAQGTIEADSVLVLPRSYGWGMRTSEDKIWGVFKADEQTHQFWELKQNVLQNHGLKTDIVYEDAAYPLTEGYQNIYYWNQNVLNPKSS